MQNDNFIGDISFLCHDRDGKGEGHDKRQYQGQWLFVFHTLILLFLFIVMWEYQFPAHFYTIKQRNKIQELRKYSLFFTASLLY